MKTSRLVLSNISRVTLLCVFSLLFIAQSKSQISVSGGTGLSATYTSLTKAGGLFAALNSAGSQSGNNIVVSITSDVTTEDGANALNAGDWASITISPSGTRTISGTVAGAMIDFNGADNVTINGLGTLTISNASTATSYTIRLRNDASTNTITNCIIKGSATTNTSYGVIGFTTGTSTGNDGNTISNNDITLAGSSNPVNGIVSVGSSSTIDNSGNQITGNNIYDYFKADSSCAGIRLGTGNNTWTISSNKFYQTATRTFSVAATHYGIIIGAGDGHTVSNNTIGSASSSNTGRTIMTKTATQAIRYIAISLAVGTTTATSVQGNLIDSITIITRNSTGTGFGSLCGIAVTAGNVNIGTVTGNIIGATSGNGSLYADQRATLGGIVGINIGTTGVATVSNNTISSFTVKDSISTHGLSAYGIYVNATASVLTISNNTIGSTTANSILAGTASSTSGSVNVSGIACVSAPVTSLTINDNTIQNLTAQGSASATGTGAVRGIYTSTTNVPTINVYNNTISNLSAVSALASFGTSLAAVQGIGIGNATTSNVYGNTITNLKNNNTGTGNYVVVGIATANGSASNGMLHKIYKNKVYGLRNAGTGTTVATPPTIAGIAIRGTSSTTLTIGNKIYNNMISLGDTITNNNTMIGIWANHGGAASGDLGIDTIYHNTVYIGGTASSGALNTFGFLRGDLSSTAKSMTCYVYNNILHNARTGGTGKHYAIANNFGAGTTPSTGWNSNNNILNSASSSTVGYWSVDKTLATWQSASSADAASATGATITYTSVANDLHINMGSTQNALESQGIDLSITDDIDGQNRKTASQSTGAGTSNGGGQAPDLGADEFDGAPTFTCTSASVNTFNASAASVSCFGTTVTMSLNGSLTGTGFAYQWRQSTNGGSTYTDISGATSSTYIATPFAASTYYLCAITCNANNSTNTPTGTEVTGPTSLSGTYTINSGSATSGTNYASFTDAVADLNCKGISGAVTFNVAGGSGPYFERVILNQVLGSSATNTITFNGNGRLMKSGSATSALRPVITLNGADYVTIDNLSINAADSTFGWGVLLTNDANYNTISNCTITTSQTNTTATNHAGIVSSGSNTSVTTTGSNAHFTKIVGNTINGGYYGVSLYGSSTNASVYNQGNKIHNNIIKNNYSNAVQLTYQKNDTISNNDINRPDITVTSSFIGVNFSTGIISSLIYNNKVHDPFTSLPARATVSFTGINNSSTNAGVGTENWIYNNLVYNVYRSDNTVNGVSISGGYCNLYHNTIVLDDTLCTAVGAITYGINATANATPLFNAKNNLIYLTTRGSSASIRRAVFLNAALATLPTMTNNNYYISAAALGGQDTYYGEYSTTKAATLTAWQVLGLDANSYDANPNFNDAANNDFYPKSGNMDNVGTNVGIGTDIVGVTRSGSTPDIGAYEFTGLTCQDPPAAGSATTTASVSCSGSSFTLNVVNNSSGAGITYQWQRSTTGGTGNWSNIGSTQTTSAYATSQTESYYYRVGVTCSGGTTIYSDSIYVLTPTLLAGNYTINSGAATAGTNFNSFNTAATYLGCGVSAPVVITVASGTGPYIEQVTFPVIPGTSAANTVTIQGNGRTLQFSTNATNSRHGIFLNGSDHVTINNLKVTLDTTNTTYGWGIVFGNGADSNTISNCTVDVNRATNTTTYSYFGIIGNVNSSSPNTGNVGEGNLITNNTIKGGYHGISFFGNGTTGNGGNNITNNTVTDFAADGIDIVYAYDCYISGNDISRLTRKNTVTGVIGIRTSTVIAGKKNIIIEKNRIHDLFSGVGMSTSTSAATGISINAGGASATDTNTVVNNIIYNMGGDGVAKGLYASQASNWRFFHNTVIMSDQTATTSATYGFDQTGGNSGIKFKNNLIYITRTGTGVKRCFWAEGTTSVIESNYNNFYMNAPSGTDNKIAAIGGTSYATLAAWNLVKSNYIVGVDTIYYDLNSISLNPVFVDAPNADYTPTVNAANDKGQYVGIATDINGTARNSSTPDIGAIEFDAAGCSNPPTPGTIVPSTTNVCPNSAIVINVTGNSEGASQTYQLQYSLTNTDGSWLDIGTPQEATSFSTSQTESRYYRVAVTCSSGTSVFTPAQFINTPLPVSGTYTINSAVATGGGNFQTFAEAISYISCGINGPVVFNVDAASGPYNEQVTIPNITGTSSTNTITINGNNRTLSYTSNDANSRAALILDGVDYVKVNNLTIDASAGTYGWGVLFTNNATDNKLNGCTILSSTTNTTSNNHYGVVWANSTTNANTVGTNGTGSYDTIQNCTITGGYNAIHCYGTSTNFTQNTSNVITGCTITDFYQYGIYNIYIDRPVITGNNISRPTRANTSSSVYGIILSSGISGASIQKNKIHNMFDALSSSTSTCYGLYIGSSAATAVAPNLVSNNVIYSQGGAGTLYGLYNTSSAYMYAYHNTIVMEGTAAATATYGIYQTGAQSNIIVKNNLVYMNRTNTSSGTTTNACIQFLTTTSSITSDNNALYSVQTSAPHYLCGWGSNNYSTLSAWQAANFNSYDQNSVSTNPSFVNAAAANYSPATLSVNTVGANVGVTDDVNGISRAGNYTAGAYQNDVLAPSISYTALTEDCGPSQSTSKNLTGVVISDAYGVEISGSTKPRVYFKKGTNGSWTSSAGTLASGNASSSTWDFNISYASISGLNNGDTIYYFVAAQDIATTPNVGSSPSGVVATDVNTISTYPTGNYFRSITYTPSLTISTASTTVCSGSNVSFNANIVDGGSSPSVSWYKNGFGVGSGSSITFLSGTLNNNDVISAVLTANNTCQTSSTANSNSIGLTVLPSPVIGQIKNSVGTVVTTATMCTLGGTTRYSDTTYGGTWSSSTPSVASINSYGIVTANSNGTAIISYGKAASNGCISTSSVTITVASEPTPNSITGNNSICKNGTTTLSTTSTGGTWSSMNNYASISGNVVTGLSAGTAVIRYTKSNANGCSAYASYNVTVNPTPMVPSISYAVGTINPQIGASGGFCTGKTFTVVGSPSGGVWSSSNVAVLTVTTSGGVINTVSAGSVSLTYTYTSAAGCVNSRTINGTVVTCAGRGVNGMTNDASIVNDNSFTMYPNPAKSFITLQVEKLVGEGQIIINDIYGKQVKMQPLSMGNNTVDITKLSKGFYLVSIITAEGKKTQKLIVE